VHILLNNENRQYNKFNNNSSVILKEQHIIVEKKNILERSQRILEAVVFALYEQACLY
jgi:hypothetical protein